MTTAGALLGAAAVASACAGSAKAPTEPTSTGTSSDPVRYRYGPDRSQFLDVYAPSGPAVPGLAVVIHGGFWRAEYDLTLGAPLAEDLARRGYTAVNLEYRRVGNGGGWPHTLQDVSDGIDALAGLQLDVSRIVAIGHSAGGQLAAWAAGRTKLPPGAPGADPQVEVGAVVAQAGVLDLATAANQFVGGTAEADFLGGDPKRVPRRYKVADPIGQVPLPAPVLCVHSRDDVNVPFAQSTAYVAAAQRAGAAATLTEVAGDHFTLIDPTTPAWLTVVDALPGLLAG